MPKSAFFNLPQQKQDKILECAFNEFSENSYDKASIFSIAQKCNISRASIYCYFADKDDVYKHITYIFLKPHIDKVKEQKDYSLFSLPKSLFDYLISFYKTSKQNFVLNLLKNMNPGYITYLARDLKHLEKCELFVNNQSLNYINQYDMFILPVMIISNMAMCILRFFENQISKLEACEYFDRTLEILKNGLKEKSYDSN